jgi:hypothetical protein
MSKIGMKILGESLEKYNNKEINKNQFIELIYDSMWSFIPRLASIDKHDVRQDICTHLLNAEDWEFKDVDSLLHYIRIIAANKNKYNFKKSMKTNIVDTGEIGVVDNQIDLEEHVINLVMKKQRKQKIIDLSINKIKTVKDFINEKGDYYITDIASFLGLSTVQIYAYIKKNYMPLETRICLERIQPYDKYATYAEIKDIIFRMFGAIGKVPFAKIGVARSLTYQWADTGIPYLRAISLIEALQVLVNDVNIKTDLDKLYDRLLVKF